MLRPVKYTPPSTAPGHTDMDYTATGARAQTNLKAITTGYRNEPCTLIRRNIPQQLCFNLIKNYNNYFKKLYPHDERISWIQCWATTSHKATCTVNLCTELETRQSWAALFTDVCLGVNSEDKITVTGLGEQLPQRGEEAWQGKGTPGCPLVMFYPWIDLSVLPGD